MNVVLEFAMLSRWHVGVGLGNPGRTDAVTLRSGSTSVIAGETIKGLLKDRASLIVAVNPDLDAARTNVFGTARQSGWWQFRSARPESTARIAEPQVSVHHRRDPTTGVVPIDGLFDLETNPPMVLRTDLAPVEGHDPGDDEIGLICASALALERLGKRRTRGYGRCRVTVALDDGGDVSGYVRLILGVNG